MKYWILLQNLINTGIYCKINVKVTVNLTVASCIMRIQNTVKLRVIFYSDTS